MNALSASHVPGSSSRIGAEGARVAMHAHPRIAVPPPAAVPKVGRYDAGDLALRRAVRCAAGGRAVKAITAGLRVIGRHRAREQDEAQPRDEIAVEAEVIRVLYGDSSARRRAHDTHACPGQPPNPRPSSVPAGRRGRQRERRAAPTGRRRRPVDAFHGCDVDGRGASPEQIGRNRAGHRNETRCDSDCEDIRSRSSSLPRAPSKMAMAYDTRAATPARRASHIGSDRRGGGCA